METVSINLTVPTGWQELDDKQLRYVYSLIANDLSLDEIKTLALLKWASPRIRMEGVSGKSKFLCSIRPLHAPHSTLHFELSALQLAEMLSVLDWLAELPATPVRLSKIRHHVAVDPDFQGVPFEAFLMVENLYQGFLHTKNDALLDELASLLYTKKFSLFPTLRSPLSTAERFSVFYWVASVKDMFAKRFPDFFQPAATETENLLGGSPNIGAQLQESMDAQIRALTKGDITKEREILSLDTWRALTELNAQAKEYKQINAQLNAKKLFAKRIPKVAQHRPCKHFSAFA